MVDYREILRLDNLGYTKKDILRFSTCQYINEGHHIILKGATGSGKT